DYSKNKNITKSANYAYYDWYINGKNPLYEKTNFNVSNGELINPETYSMDLTNYIQLCICFNNVKYQFQDNIEKIGLICKNNPNCNINKLLELYFNIINFTH